MFNHACMHLCAELECCMIHSFFFSVAYAPYNFFKKRGIKGPTPVAVFGNALEFGKANVVCVKPLCIIGILLGFILILLT